MDNQSLTIIQQRVAAVKARNHQPKCLLPFAGNAHKNNTFGMPFLLKDYIQLVDETGRIQRENKRGKIAATQLPLSTN